MRGALLLSLISWPALAQPAAFFGTGDAPVFVEQEADRRFARSRIARGLAEGSSDPNCKRVLTALLAFLAETAPTLHKRDENFYLDPVLLEAIQSRLSSPNFPANAAIVGMVRRVLIDGRLPPQWLAVASALDGGTGQIDLAKLRFVADGLEPIDSFYFNLAALKDRFDAEVKRATSAARRSALKTFREGYLDHHVAWGGVSLLDVRQARKKLTARLEYRGPEPEPSPIDLLQGRKREKTLAIDASLSPNQYLDVALIPKGTRVIVRGRFYALSDDLSRLEVREALLFQDPDWRTRPPLVEPESVARCPLATADVADPRGQRP